MVSQRPISTPAPPPVPEKSVKKFLKAEGEVILEYTKSDTCAVPPGYLYLDLEAVGTAGAGGNGSYGASKMPIGHNSGKTLTIVIGPATYVSVDDTKLIYVHNGTETSGGSFGLADVNIPGTSGIEYPTGGLYGKLGGTGYIRMRFHN